ncbi:ABC transporter ATP-binding protein [Methylobacterium nodulans]|uniref:ABC transporter related n=1 Tax=Methylobacterium nodulans (strain LMG 21967 / CNCM I-2342 / ORS 2060) TaxID=460265 RepID=B8II64_METNO|nr:ABC transporter ATP-binding protein [Methylobacterium nodulans]ACL57933.1 ABC transporter related [Methylobacterium nodulans ORS 2060]
MLDRSATQASAVPVVRDIIAAHHLSRRFGGASDSVVALQDISFTVRDGEFISIVGPSGCGKSTLLKILAGLLPASDGEAYLNGTRISGPRRDIGVVFQSPVLFPWRTVLGNSVLPGDVQGLDKARIRERALSLLNLVGLSGFEHRYPWQLSGGMQQRVALVRALVHDPAMLLMDEPFGALDALTRESMNVELQRIWLERRKTVVFITHSTAEAVFLADRVLVMSPRPGRIQDELVINLPRPRSLDVMNTEKFGAYVRQIRKDLNAAGGGIE